MSRAVACEMYGDEGSSLWDSKDGRLRVDGHDAEPDQLHGVGRAREGKRTTPDDGQRGVWRRDAGSMRQRQWRLDSPGICRRRDRWASEKRGEA